MGEFQRVSETLERFGNLGEFLRVWERFGRDWETLRKFGRVLDEFGRVWESLGEFARVCESLGEFG